MTKSDPHLFQYHSLKSTSILIALGILAALIAQIGYDWGSGPGGNKLIGIAVGIIAIAVYLIAFFKPLKKLIDTPPFAVMILLFTALATASGTFISQGAPKELFVDRYGETGSKILYQLQLNDVFHSWWYIALYVLLLLSLLKISSKRHFNLPHLGFHLAHLSPLIIIFGFWLDYFSGYRGMIKLEVGQETNQVTLYKGNSNYIGGTLDLGYSVRLDSFDFENFDPDYRIQLWEQGRSTIEEMVDSGVVKEKKVPGLITTFGLNPGKTRKIYGTDISFSLDEFYPNFYFSYTYPDNKDTIPLLNPGMVIEVRSPGGPQYVKMSAEDTTSNNISDAHFSTNLRFYWDIPQPMKDSLDQGLRLTSFDESDWFIISGSKETVYELRGDQVVKNQVDPKRFHLLAEEPVIGFYIQLFYPDPEYLDAKPASRDDILEKPVAKILVKRKSWEAPKEAFVFPAKGQNFGFYTIPDSKYFLALESLKDRETKFWKSSLSMIGNEGQILEQGAVKVNEFMKFKGHRFYQTDFDPDNPNYSGIGVSREPGLNIIYFGFFCLVIGVLLMFYWHNHPQEIHHSHPEKG